MNRQSPIYKALEERGEGRKLPLDFSFAVMSRIRVEESRRKRSEMWWAIVGYAVAAILAVFTVVYFCGDIFKDAIHSFMISFATGKTSASHVSDNMVKSFESSWSSAGSMLAVLVPATALLLALDYFFRKRIAMRFNHRQA